MTPGQVREIQTKQKYGISNKTIHQDYTHPLLGGGIGPGHKVVGGFDFVGDAYNGEHESEWGHPFDITTMS